MRRRMCCYSTITATYNDWGRLKTLDKETLTESPICNALGLDGRNERWRCPDGSIRVRRTRQSLILIYLIGLLS